MTCVRCGRCLEACPTYRAERHERLSPRGRTAVLSFRGASFKGAVRSAALSCLQCGACEAACPLGWSPRELVLKAREEAGVRLPRFLLRAAEGKGPGVGASLFLRLAARLGLRSLQAIGGAGPSSGRLPKGGDGELLADGGRLRVALFVGCGARYLFPREAEAALALLGGRVLIPEGQVCCGAPLISGGRLDEARRLFKKNLAAFEGTSPDRVVTACASCARALRDGARLLFEPGSPEARAAGGLGARAVHLADLLLETGLFERLRPSGAEGVFYHMPCHERLGGGIQGAELMKRAFPGLSGILEECCGGGGLVPLLAPAASERVFREARKGLEGRRARLLVTSCSGCLLRWRSGLKEGGIQVLGLGEALSRLLP